MAFRMGIDVGGTFTDFALFDDVTGRMAIHKQLTTPRDPSQAVIDGCATLLARHKVPIGELAAIVHGTTLVTNAVIERKGARTGMLVTKGFRDVLDIALERRYDLFDLRLKFPEPLVARELRVEVDERVRYDGSIKRALDVEAACREVEALRARATIDALAICFMHAYANPTHEQQVRDALVRRFPDLCVSISSEVFPFIREYERWTTTTINVYAQPMVDRYLERLESGLKARGFGGGLFIMASNGGTITPTTARRFPVRMLESGPAAGALMSAFHGRALDLPDLLSFDMGGTTAKGSLIRQHRPLKKYDLEVARIHEFKAGSGLPVRIPVIDMIEIGAGGGSIAEVDPRGVIRVGPRSAGADPGPACYARGGDRPTLTDANLALGYLDPRFFLGGEMALDQPAATRVIGARVGDALRLDVTRAAWGIHEMINEDVARAFRVHASERGFDYRGSSMVAFGGCGPIHALRIARKLKIPRVVFPVGAGVMSAFGLLASPLAFEIVKSDIVRLDELAADQLAARFRPLIAETGGYLREAGTRDADIRVLRRLDMRYFGQGYEIEVVLPDGEDWPAIHREIAKLFARAYEQVFSMSFLDQPIEIVNWKVETSGPAPKMSAAFRLQGARAAGAARKASRPAFFPESGGFVDCAVYDRYALEPGAVVAGPALIEENESTVVVGVGDRVSVDPHFNLVAEIARAEASS
jgi:N-methylhydantoinase A